MNEEGVLALPSGRKVGWRLRGDASARVVAWLHGQPGSRRDTDLVPLQALASRGIRLLSIDRAGYGDTSPTGLDRRDVAADLLAVADHVGAERFPIIAVSMGAIYALATAVLAPARVEGLVLAAGHVLPYDDPEVYGALSASEQEDVDLLRQGREAAESAYAGAASRVLADPHGLLRRLAAGWSAAERSFADGPTGAAVADSLAFGLTAGYEGMLDDGLRTIRPLEFDLDDVRCPVVAIHGESDDLEPYVNVRRLATRLPGLRIIAMPDMGHFAPWVWPGIPLDVLPPTAEPGGHMRPD
jgi:pimeloyl-ACP methyl ester carboxylesterase